MSNEEAPAYPVIYRYRGDGSEWLNGVPARDLTLVDFDALEEAAKDDLLAHVKRSDGLYEQVMTVARARQAAKGPAKKGKASKGEQLDPDPNTPGRVDADVVGSGEAVPETDAPIGEGAPGYIASDSGAPNPQEG